MKRGDARILPDNSNETRKERNKLRKTYAWVKVGVNN